MSKLGNWVRALWLAACGAVVVFVYASPAGSEAVIAGGWFMLLLTFPAGLLISVIGWALAPLQGADTARLVLDLLLWLTWILLGYLQWFVVLPWLWRRRNEGVRGDSQHGA